MPPLALRTLSRASRCTFPAIRAYSTESTAPVTVFPPSSRWLSDAKLRIEKFISSVQDPELEQRANRVKEVLAKDWKELAAGSEGYLTSDRWAGLVGHRIAWGEEDRLKHVNNANYARYAESSRVNLIYNIAEHFDPDHGDQWRELVTANGIGWILRSIKIDYKFPMTWPDEISVFHKLRAPPSSSSDSIILDALIMSHRQQRPAARIVDDLVIYNYTKGKKTALLPFMVKVFTETFRLQEEVRLINSKRVADLLEEIKALEKGIL